MIFFKQTTKSGQIQSRPLVFATISLVLYSIILTLSPAVRSHSWNVDYRWSHWIGFCIWLLMVNITHWQNTLTLKSFDPYLFPIATFLSGWGLLTIWRLNPNLGLRQSIWFTGAIILFIVGIKIPSLLSFLRKYKYLWLFIGLLAIGSTLFIGTNPLGFGPKMWLSCCGFFIQPSEPLKLLLVIFLAAYFADNQQFSLIPTQWQKGTNNTEPLPLIISTNQKRTLLPTIAPTLMILVIAGALLLIQRDLGTAFIIFFLYTTIIFLATGNKKVIIFGLISISFAMVIGYFLFDVVKIRIDAWIDPWSDPSGSTYQIVQSLIAVANGNILGRGPGIGNPGLIPLSYSDFIFSAMTEETGFIGAIVVFILLVIFAGKGLIAAIKASSIYKKYLAAGLIALLTGQSLLIIGGNIQVFPLTGITLPFVSYGGSSLISSYFALLLLVKISTDKSDFLSQSKQSQSYIYLLNTIFVILITLSLATGWWAILQSKKLLSRSDNPRRAIADQSVLRGSILDRSNTPVNTTTGDSGNFVRTYLHPELSNTIGYNNPVYGQSGIENTMDPYLRGIAGNHGITIWWNQLLYGQPPPGRDIRLSISLDIQKIVKKKMQLTSGALILLNTKSGEVLALHSLPTFDANNLENEWENLIIDPNAPLLNRVTQGVYPVGSAIMPLIYTNSIENNDTQFSASIVRMGKQSKNTLNCTIASNGKEIGDLLSNGCNEITNNAVTTLSSKELIYLFQKLGYYSVPEIRLPTSPALSLPPSDQPAVETLAELQISPLQMATSYAVLTNSGVLPAPQIVTSVNLPEENWTILKPLGQTEKIFSPQSTVTTTELISTNGSPFWNVIATVKSNPRNKENITTTWFITGTMPSMQTNPIVLVIVLEEDNPNLAQEIGKEIIEAAIFH